MTVNQPIRFSGSAILAVFSGYFVASLRQDSPLRHLSGIIAPAFFGMHIHHAGTTTSWPVIRFGAWRLWDAHSAWPDLEPRRGQWNWVNLDQYVALAEQHQVEILLPLGLSPPWASARPAEPSSYGVGSTA